jgi:hypothetical protein
LVEDVAPTVNTPEIKELSGFTYNTLIDPLIGVYTLRNWAILSVSSALGRFGTFISPVYMLPCL